MSSIESHLSNKPKQVFFNPINIFNTFTTLYYTIIHFFNILFSFNVNFLIYRPEKRVAEIAKKKETWRPSKRSTNASCVPTKSRASRRTATPKSGPKRPSNVPTMKAVTMKMIYPTTTTMVRIKNIKKSENGERECIAYMGCT